VEGSILLTTRLGACALRAARPEKTSRPNESQRDARHHNACLVATESRYPVRWRVVVASLCGFVLPIAYNLQLTFDCKASEQETKERGR
jgi:hypothetical protein